MKRQDDGLLRKLGRHDGWLGLLWKSFDAFGYCCSGTFSCVFVEEDSRKWIEVVGLVAIASLLPLSLKYGIRRR